MTKFKCNGLRKFFETLKRPAFESWPLSNFLIFDNSFFEPELVASNDLVSYVLLLFFSGEFGQKENPWCESQRRLVRRREPTRDPGPPLQPSAPDREPSRQSGSGCRESELVRKARLAPEPHHPGPHPVELISYTEELLRSLLHRNLKS